jgi:uncharacterized protein (TIGR02271 family)
MAPESATAQVEGNWKMAITLVGIFDSVADAQDARRLLLQEGLDESMVRLTSSDTASMQGGAVTTEDRRGFFARLFGLDEPDENVGHYAEAVRRGSTIVTVELDDESRASQIVSLLEESGAIDVDRRMEQWKASGYTGYDPTAAPYTADEAQEERETFKVMKEELRVGKRAVESGAVRVHRRMTEKPVSEQITLREEKAVVDRRPVDREATPAELEAFGKADRDILLRETAEEPVVSKTARVIEEVSVGKEARERTETINDTVRSTEVEVEKLGADRMKQPQSRPQPPPSQR